MSQREQESPIHVCMTIVLLSLLSICLAACGDLMAAQVLEQSTQKSGWGSSSAEVALVVEAKTCPSEPAREEIACKDVLDSASEQKDALCKCTAKSWCEVNGEGACICYTAVSDCG